MNTEFEIPGYLKLSAQCGLLGHVTANLAGVHGHIEEKRVLLWAYFFAEPTEDDRECIELTATEVIADFPTGYTIETHFGLRTEINLNAKVSWIFLRVEAASKV